jgi:Xaa-Pro aminopeptidase
MTETRSEAAATRLAQTRELLARRDIPAVFLETRRAFAWLTAGGSNHVVTGGEMGVAGILVTRGDVRVITSRIERDRIATEEVADLGWDVEAVDWWVDDAAYAAAGTRAGGSVARDADVEADLLALRSRLSPLDQERLVELGRVATRAVEDTLAGAAPGMTEAALGARLAGSLGGRRSPVVLVAADERIARFRHPIPTDTEIRGRVMLVLVAEQWGLNAAVTRFRDWEPLTDDLRARFEGVRDVERAMHEATVPGATLGDVIAAAQAAYARAGHPDAWQEHHQGGTIAYMGRERVAVPGDPTRIEPGMAFAWNPSIAGAKVEDTFILGDDGTRRIVTTTA